MGGSIYTMSEQLHAVAQNGVGVPRPPLFVAPQPASLETGLPAIRKVFIANRGEIACRVIATCRMFQIQTVVVYVREYVLYMPRWVALMFVVWLIDGTGTRPRGTCSRPRRRLTWDRSKTTPVNPFLSMELLIRIATETGAQAVYPGYGYLSENAEFAAHVESS